MEAFLCLLFFACMVFLNKRCGTSRSHKGSNPANGMRMLNSNIDVSGNVYGSDD